MDNGRPTKEDLFWILVLAALLFSALCAVNGCGGNSANVKPDNDLETSLKNQQEMSEKIEKIDGDLTKIQQSISTVTNMVTQTFETLQGSTKTGDVGNDVITKKSSNSALYGIGLVAVVLIFVLIFIWLMARILKGLASKILK